MRYFYKIVIALTLNHFSSISLAKKLKPVTIRMFESKMPYSKLFECTDKLEQVLSENSNLETFIRFFDFEILTGRFQGLIRCPSNKITH